MSTHAAASILSNESNERDFGLQRMIKNSRTHDDSVSLLEWFDSQETISLHGIEHDPDRQSSSIKFRLAGPASSYFPILRGLIALGRPRTFNIQAAAKTRSFTLQSELDQEAEVKHYLEAVFALMHSEIRFKQVLRKIIANQTKFQLEEKLLFHSL